MDQGARVGKFLHKEKLFDLLCVVHGGLAADTNYCVQLVHFSCSFNVLKVYISILADVDNRAAKVVQPFVRLVRLKQANKFFLAELFCVLCSGLHNDLKVGFDVVSKQHVEAPNAILRGEGSKEVHQEFWCNTLGVYDDTLDIVDFGVVLESTLVQTTLFAQLCDVVAVVVTKHIAREDCVSHLRGAAQQVDFEQTSLKCSFVFPVALKSLQQECGGLLDAVQLKKDIHDLAHINKTATFVADQALCKLLRCFGVLAHQIL
mmetsp:Transcript_21715/g.40606  ORF Transcript_21715/g.40606 Transcript_21715/m.40606 type:complete len:261 (+) Transcript_21715:2813-3595(+)